jgi:hypothetical protein
VVQVLPAITVAPPVSSHSVVYVNFRSYFPVPFSRWRAILTNASGILGDAERMPKRGAIPLR